MKYNNVVPYKIKFHGYMDINPDNENYCVHGVCHCGSRHISENLNYENALALMPEYIGLVEYFGGGTVALINCKTGQILRSKKID